MSTGGEVANALVCKTSIRRFNSGPVLQQFEMLGKTTELRAPDSRQASTAWCATSTLAARAFMPMGDSVYSY